MVAAVTPSPAPHVAGAVFEPEHELFRETVRGFLADRVLPRVQEWEDAGIVDRGLYVEAAKAGLLGFAVPEEFGGGGTADFRLNAVIDDEFGRALAGSAGLCLSLQNDIVEPYFLELTDDEQKARWLPGLATGETVLAIAMTEPGTGSDLAGISTRAVRDGSGPGADWIVDGAKTFISSGQNADLVVVAVRTSTERGRGLSLLVVERGMPGFERGRNLAKLGLHGQDTSELSFSGVRVPAANMLGIQGSGFPSLLRNLAQERLGIAVSAVGGADGALAQTLAYVTERKVFGSPVGSFQSAKFLLAELATEVDVARTFVTDAVGQHVAGTLTPARAAKAKWWATEMQARVTDRCVQLHGGYGYMREYAVGRAFLDARVQTIYGGTTEIMKEIIGRDLGL